MRGLAIWMGVLALTALIGRAAPSLLDSLWDSRFTLSEGSSENQSPSDSTIFATLSDGTNVYVGGKFTSLDGIAVTNIARWDGVAWHGLGSGVDGPVKSISFYGGRLVAGGSFDHAGTTEARNIAAWDGQAWNSLGGGFSPDATDEDSTYGVNALATLGGSLFAAGHFNQAGGANAKNIARWDGVAWYPLLMTYTNYVLLLEHVQTNNGINGPVYALTSSGGNLVAGGSFLQNTGARLIAPAITLPVYATNIVQWDGANWSGLGWAAAGFFGQAGAVRSLALYQGDLVAGGTFSKANGDPFDGIATRHGTSWKPLTQGVNGSVLTLLAADTHLYAAGYFSSASGANADSVAAWDGANWAAAAAKSPANNDSTVINTLASDQGGNLYAGGLFSQIDTAQVQNFAVRGAGGWSGLGCGLVEGSRSGAGYAMVRFNGKTIVAGAFRSAGGVDAANIATWDGSRWGQLGAGLIGSVSALATDGTYLYAGGNFTVPGDSSGVNTAWWNGNKWRVLGGGVDRPVHAMEVMGGHLYVGGEFKTAGSLHAEGIVQWDGADWKNVGSPQALALGKVYVLKTVGNQLYVGGLFGHNAPGNSIALWDGTSWSPLGKGLTSRVYASAYALASSGNRLVVAGNFDTAGDVPANNLAVWDGSAWTTIGDPNGIVFALQFVGNSLFVGGSFESGFGVSANRISKWDGQTWSGLGSGATFPDGSGAFVQSLLVDGDNLLVGGNFSQAGGKPSYGFGIYSLLPPPVQTGGGAPPVVRAMHSNGSMVVEVDGEAAGYVLETSSDLGSVSDGWSTLASLTGSTNIVVGTEGARRFFRIRK
ncbi:MAG TPA: hypothetical protein VMF06_17005 [Candidatus Limnocylindria bacterium]|nr:hypothetical protein [Candidatus Limnocylindria bacterium]